MRERDLLAHIYQRSANDRHASVAVGPGDDCAVLRIGGAQVLVTTDQLVEGRHYHSEDEPELVARKAMARAISDIAAMAGRPTAAVVAATLPPGLTNGAALVDRLRESAQHFDTPLVGGDVASSTTDAPVVITATILGSPHPQRGPVLRSTARVGDAVWVTGELGGAWSSAPNDRHSKQHTFVPRVAEAWSLADELGAELRSMIDLSDGLGVDAARIATASGVRIELDAAALPVSPRLAGEWRRALSDGEDYELAFTADAGDDVRVALDRVAERLGVAITRVGRVTAGEGCVVHTPDGETLGADDLGWEHG
jgi:thiamine-monophosphate kinase